MNDNPEFNEAAARIYRDAVKKFNISTTPKLILKKDEENGSKTLGKTAYYDPNNSTVVLYTSGRHSKDILRSFAEHMRNMEKEAYLEGNLLMRDFEDNFKNQ